MKPNRNDLFLLCAVVWGCGPNTPKPTEPVVTAQEEPMPQENPASAKPLSLTGTLEDGGLSRGKTMAAWNGIPTGERYYVFTPDEGQPTIDQADTHFMVQYPKQDNIDALVNQRVTLTGTWNIPKPVEYNPEQPRQMPIGGGPGGHEIIQPQVTFTATAIQGVP